MFQEDETLIVPSAQRTNSTSDLDMQPTSIGILNGQTGPICFETYPSPVAFLPDSEGLLVCTETGVQINNIASMEVEFVLEPRAKLAGSNVALSMNGETLAWALEDNSIQLIRLSDQNVLYTVQVHSGPIGEIEFSSGSGNLFSAAHDGWVKELDSDGQVANEFQPGGGEILGIGISADGKILATIPSDGPVTLWDTTNYQMVAELGGTGGYDTSDVAFSSTGQFAAADLATGLAVWDIKVQSLLWDGVNSMAFAFSPIDDILAYSDINQNNDIILSSPDGKRVGKELSGHQGPVWEIIYSPDGQLLASTDGIDLRIWHVNNRELLYIGKSDCP